MTLIKDVCLTETDLRKAFAARKRQMSEQTQLIARRIFIHQEPIASLAREYGLSRGRINDIRKQVLAAYLESIAVPETWKTVTLTASPQLIKEILTKVQAEHQAWLTQKAEPAPTAERRRRKIK